MGRYPVGGVVVGFAKQSERGVDPRFAFVATIQTSQCIRGPSQQFRLGTTGFHIVLHFPNPAQGMIVNLQGSSRFTKPQYVAEFLARSGEE